MGGLVGKPKRSVKNDYVITYELGSGGFSVVKLAVNKKSGVQCAVKIVEKSKLTEADLLSLQQEVDILNSLNHPNIIKCYEVYDEPEFYYIVTELVTGGELFDRILTKVHYTEKEARDLSKILLTSIKYLHSIGIVHRDLKPENLLLCTDENDAEIKLCDFGLAKRIADLTDSEPTLGTPAYIAPEILRGDKYGAEVDIWSSGVIIYFLIAGIPPFYVEDPTEQKNLFKKIKSGKFCFWEEYFAHVSKEAQDMIQRMLTVSQNDRWTIDQLLEHPWLKMDENQLSATDLSSTIEVMKKWNAKIKFKGAARLIMSIRKMADKSFSESIKSNSFSGVESFSDETDKKVNEKRSQTMRLVGALEPKVPIIIDNTDDDIDEDATSPPIILDYKIVT
jgi:serine/threonine protein kinase